MWLLENDGDVFHGKRLWLRPGKRFIFGRTSAEAGGFVIENKTISRKHLIVKVDHVEPSECYKPNNRSRVTLEDLNTKIGTLVNGIQIRGQRHSLDTEKSEIKLGQFDKLFRIAWAPVVLSFSFTGKELKADLLQSISEKLEPLDIKVSLDYLRDRTTHVVSAKRNTSKGLQALINGKYIVNHSFVDAVVAAADSEPDQISPLESDFDSNWPDELQYLPPRGTEPTQRPPDAYAPDLKRHDTFDGYTFIFYEESQFDNLLAPITDGRGKALLRRVEPLKTGIEDFIRYVKEVAGEKSLGEFEDGSEGRGVVVVRHQPLKGPTLDWYAEFGRQVALHLDHRLIEQNEFLDAILNNDASVLRKPLEVEESSVLPPTPAAATVINLKSPPAAIPSSSAIREDPITNEAVTGFPSAPLSNTRKIGRTRRTVTSRFEGFGDDFDSPIEHESIAAGHVQGGGQGSQNLGLFVHEPGKTEFDNQSSNITLTQTRSSRKRASPPPPLEEEEEDVLDQLAPAAARLKRRRLAYEQERRSRGEPLVAPPSPVAEPVVRPIKTRHKKEKPEMDVLEVARQQREKEDAIARAEREALEESMDGIDIEQIRNLAVIEEMEVNRTSLRPHPVTRADESDRWDERWNGRKNFKGFRRKGEGGLRAINKVIVQLEEVKKKDFGIGDEYWLEGERDTQRKKRGKGRARESQPFDNEELEPLRSRGHADEVGPADDTQTIESLDVSNMASLGPQKLLNKTNLSERRLSPNKRAAEPQAKPAPIKKARQCARRQDSEDSEDGLGFRFRKKK